MVCLWYQNTFRPEVDDRLGCVSCEEKSRAVNPTAPGSMKFLCIPRELGDMESEWASFKSLHFCLLTQPSDKSRNLSAGF
ncbi:unnamed protein product [Pleuronectes platessa]|uniref:Uncharacterized protein n=1 Tax=Pleuronectes platessa TaxID=8262 RepID=A0A9N7TKJ8_PLEPL|nr:unnamed protein product [Pleuronectes platessa]